MRSACQEMQSLDIARHLDQFTSQQATCGVSYRSHPQAQATTSRMTDTWHIETSVMLLHIATQSVPQSGLNDSAVPELVQLQQFVWRFHNPMLHSATSAEPTNSKTCQLLVVTAHEHLLSTTLCLWYAFLRYKAGRGLYRTPTVVLGPASQSQCHT